MADPTKPIRVVIPEFDEAEAAVKAGEATQLQKFVYEYEPAGRDDEAWRETLAAMLSEVVANAR